MILNIYYIYNTNFIVKKWQRQRYRERHIDRYGENMKKLIVGDRETKQKKIQITKKQVYTGIHRYTHIYTDIHRYAHVYIGIHMYTHVYTGIHRYTQ